MSCNDVCVCAHLEALLNVLGGTFLFHIAESVKYISQLAISSMSKRSPDPPLHDFSVYTQDRQAVSSSYLYLAGD